MKITSSDVITPYLSESSSKKKSKSCSLSAELGIFPSVEDVKKHPNLVAQDAVELILHKKSEGFSSPENSGHIRIRGGHVNLELIPLTQAAHLQLKLREKKAIQDVLLPKYDKNQTSLGSKILSVSQDIIKEDSSN